MVDIHIQLTKIGENTQAMSNGEDVLDSWEEINEVDLDKSLQQLKTEKNIKQESLNSGASVAKPNLGSSTEDFRPMKVLHRPPMHDAGIQQQQQHRPQQESSSSANAADELSALDTMEESFKPVIMMLHNTNDEYSSANYTAPTVNQTVKILRRPSQQSESARRNGMGKPKQPIKTLQQREQEYAEARLRIMGAAKNPEDDLTVTLDKQKKPITNTTGPVAMKFNSQDAASTSFASVKEKPELTPTDNKLIHMYYPIESNVAGYASNIHMNYMPQTSSQSQPPPPPAPHQASQPPYGYAAMVPAELYHNRPMTILPMSSQQPPPAMLPHGQNYPHLNTGLYQIHQPTSRPFSKQFNNLTAQGNMPKNCPVIFSATVSQQQQQQMLSQQTQNKVYYLKNNNNNNHINSSNKSNHNPNLQQDNILRYPRGPDGTQGFHVRR